MKEIEFGAFFQDFIENNVNSKYKFDMFLREIESFQGIPDYIGVNIRDIEECKSFLTNVTEENWYTVSRILSILSKQKGHTVSFIEKKTGISENSLIKDLCFLQNRNILEQDRYGNYRLAENFVIPKLSISSFELKLENWKRALFQAIRYKTFSEFSYVVMPKEKITLLKKKFDFFKQSNIGIAVYDERKDTLETIYRATKNKNISKSHLYYMSGKIMFAYQNNVNVSSSISII